MSTTPRTPPTRTPPQVTASNPKNSVWVSANAGTGKTQTSGTRWGPDGEDQTGAWYSGNTQYTRLGVGGVNN